MAADSLSSNPLVDRLRVWARHLTQSGVRNSSTRQRLIVDLETAIRELEARPAPETFPALPQRYRVQQDKGEYALKGCADGDLVDWSAYEALLRYLARPALKANHER